ncbi:hypothetical protein [Undibacterium sp.]|uniref:hypothetical protein n=1 Tax=Undibacterium sp. TaxID=1914977 RepID=UPI002BBC8B1B|nr:hypothetical protein [Undibacterium sp.]HTD02696.1 hypothetical protein [Undibacterium sp.]
MAKLEDIVGKQKPGAQFVLSAPMLGLSVTEFDKAAKMWLEQGGPGFKAAGVPFRKVIDGVFLIQRITVVKLAD